MPDETTKWYGVDDAKIRRITTDPAGGTTTYGARIDVPGIRSVGVTGDVNSTELRGDGMRLDQQSTLGGLSLSFEFAKKSLDLMAVLAGGTVVSGGTAPATTATWTLSGSDQFSYFEFESMTRGVDTVGGDGHIILYKCVITGFPEIGHVGEDFQTYTVDTACMPLLSNGQVISVQLNETAVPIAA